MVKKCLFCKNDFKAIRSSRQFCSRDCRGLSQRNSSPQKCPMCNSTFRDRSSRKRQYCSMPCYRKSRLGKRLTTPNIVKCIICDKQFIAKLWSVKNRGKKYCSRKCVVLSQIGKSPMLGKKHSLETRKKLSLSHIGKVGELASNWKGGIWRIGTPSKENKGERMRFRQTIQHQVLERDNYTCQLCGLRGVNLQVDHIQSWKDCVELRFSLDNCRTLCSKCHYKITFGREMPQEIKTWGHNLKSLIAKGVASN